MITRISKLKGFDHILAGRDLANVFEEGHVYQITKVMGQIIIKDLGIYAESEMAKGDFTSIMLNGTYLLTVAENEKQLSNL